MKRRTLIGHLKKHGCNLMRTEVKECGTESRDFCIAADAVANQIPEYFAFVTVVSGFNLRFDPAGLLVCYG